MESKDYERLAKLEAQIEAIGKVVTRMDAKFDAWASNFVPRNEYTVMCASKDATIAEIKKEIREMKENQSKNKALWPAWVAVAIATVALIINLVGGK